MGSYLDGQPLQPHTLIMRTVGACQDLHGQTAAVYSLTPSLPAQAFMVKCESRIHGYSPESGPKGRAFIIKGDPKDNEYSCDRALDDLLDKAHIVEMREKFAHMLD